MQETVTVTKKEWEEYQSLKKTDMTKSLVNALNEVLKRLAVVEELLADHLHESRMEVENLQFIKK